MKDLIKARLLDFDKNLEVVSGYSLIENTLLPELRQKRSILVTSCINNTDPYLHAELEAVISVIIYMEELARDIKGEI